MAKKETKAQRLVRHKQAVAALEAAKAAAKNGRSLDLHLKSLKKHLSKIASTYWCEG